MGISNEYRIRLACDDSAHVQYINDTGRCYVRLLNGEYEEVRIVFTGESREDCVNSAIDWGWRIESERVICPVCFKNYKEGI